MKNLSMMSEKQVLIGVLNPYDNKDKLQTLVKKKVDIFSLELLPRITRAQIYGYFILTSKSCRL